MLKSSLGANLKTIITINDYTEGHDFTGAALVLDNMGEPDQAFSTIAGNDFDGTHLNLDLLKKIHAS